MSSIGAQHASGTGVIATLNQIETLIDGAAPAVAFLRSAYFVETWSEVAKAVVEEGALPSFVDLTRKIPMVSTIDVGREAAALLCETWIGKRIVELSGPEDRSAIDVAAAFSSILGRPVEPLLVPPDERAAVLAMSGVDDKAAAALLGMYEGISNNLFAREVGNEQRRGEVPLAVSVERIVSAFRAA